MNDKRGRSRHQEFGQVGGHPALDLVNTVEWRLDRSRAIDNLPDYQAVLDWSWQVQLVTSDELQILGRLAEAEATAAARELRVVTTLREDIDSALVNGSAAAADRVVALYRGSVRQAEFRHTGSTWDWVDATLALRTPRDRVARLVVGLMASPDVALVHRCEDAVCGWIYLDRSPRHNRRWCAAADCGNRNRVRRYYARQARSTG